MKLLFILSALFFVTTKESCKHKTEKLYTGCYKGRLEIKANCMNYTISVLNGPVDTSLIVSKWVDETTNKSYKNVFALGSRCSFPNTINAGDEFYFMIDSTTAQNCAVCMMYYPTPPKHISIKVLDKPCVR